MKSTCLSKCLVWLFALACAGQAACGSTPPAMTLGPTIEPGAVPPPIPPPVYYDLTLSAAQCEPLEEHPSMAGVGTSLPVDVQSRTYLAEVRPMQDGLSASVSGSNLPTFGFGLIRSGDRLQFTIDGPAFFEALPNFRYLEIFGSGETTVESLDSPEITIPFSGSFEYCVLNLPKDRSANCFATPAAQRTSYSICQSSNHRMTLRRR